MIGLLDASPEWLRDVTRRIQRWVLTIKVTGQKEGHLVMTNASDFKARCLAILDNFRDIGKRVAILERGRPVVEFSCVTGDSEWNPQTKLEGKVVTLATLLDRCFPRHFGTAPDSESVARRAHTAFASWCAQGSHGELPCTDFGGNSQKDSTVIPPELQ